MDKHHDKDQHDREGRLSMLEKNAKDAQHNVLVVEWEKDGTKWSILLDLNIKALLALAARPLAAGLYEERVLDELRARGALLNDAIGEDGVVIPAMQTFDAATGNRIRLEHHQADQLQDPEPHREFRRAN